MILPTALLSVLLVLFAMDISVFQFLIAHASIMDTLTNLANFGLQLMAVAIASVLPEKFSVNLLPVILLIALLASSCTWLRVLAVQLVFQARQIVLIQLPAMLISLVRHGPTVMMSVTIVLAMLISLSHVRERSALKVCQLALPKNNSSLWLEVVVHLTNVFVIRTCVKIRSQSVPIMSI